MLCEIGVKTMCDKLDILFLKDENIHVYLAFKDFYIYHCLSVVNIMEFLVKFESLNHKHGIFGIKLSAGVQIFSLFSAANGFD